MDMLEEDGEEALYFHEQQIKEIDDYGSVPEDNVDSEIVNDEESTALFVVDKRPDMPREEKSEKSSDDDDVNDENIAVLADEPEEDDDPDIIGYIDTEATEFRPGALCEAQSLDDKIVLPLPRKRHKKKPPASTAGPGWFHLPRSSDALQTDTKVLAARNFLDPKRFYKKTDPAATFSVIGTVIAGKFEPRSATLRKKERKSTLAAQLLAEDSTRYYTKRKYSELQDAKRPRPRKTKLLQAISDRKKKKSVVGKLSTTN